jgi:hypothetical protein
MEGGRGGRHHEGVGEVTGGGQGVTSSMELIYTIRRRAIQESNESDEPLGGCMA